MKQMGVMNFIHEINQLSQSKLNLSITFQNNSYQLFGDNDFSTPPMSYLEMYETLRTIEWALSCSIPTPTMEHSSSLSKRRTVLP